MIAAILEFLKNLFKKPESKPAPLPPLEPVKQERLSQHFRRSEFACHCGCGFDDVDPQLIAVLEVIRADLDDRPMTILSGCRCPEHNEAVGGARNSQHLYGKAADIKVEGVMATRVANVVDAIWPNELGLGRYGTFTHIDVRGGKARWIR